MWRFYVMAQSGEVGFQEGREGGQCFKRWEVGGGGGGWGGSTAGLGHDVNPAPPRRISFAAEDWKRECIFRPGMALANGVVWLAPLSLCQQQAVRDWNTSHWPTALSNGASGSSVAVHTLGRKYTKINWGETGKFVLMLVHAVSCECE